jgi:hypothetical protein
VNYFRVKRFRLPHRCGHFTLLNSLLKYTRVVLNIRYYCSQHGAFSNLLENKLIGCHRLRKFWRRDIKIVSFCLLLHTISLCFITYLLTFHYFPFPQSIPSSQVSFLSSFIPLISSLFALIFVTAFLHYPVTQLQGTEFLLKRRQSLTL